MSIAYLVTALEMATYEPLYYSQLQDVKLRAARPWFARFRSMRAPNGQPILRLRYTGRYLLVYTRSRTYYMRRSKLRLWRKL